MKHLLFITLFLFSTLINAATSITAVVTFPPGGGLDQSMRHYQKYVKTNFDIDITFDYKAGADSLIGSQYLNTVPKDGTIIGFTSIAGLASVVKNNKFEFDYVSATRRYDEVIVVSKNTNINDFDDLVNKLRSDAVLSFGIGTPAHKLQIDQLLTNINPKNPQILVNYKGASPIVNDLLGDHINAAMLPVATVREHVAAGKLKVLGTTLGLAQYNVPAMSKKYNKWIDISGYCIVFPKNTKTEIVEYWKTITKQYLSDPTVLNDFKNEWSVPIQPGDEALKGIINSINKL
jgi:tripartite-type tricarboxylate transporter receptor subunit TctC